MLHKLLFLIAKHYRHAPVPKWIVLASDLLLFVVAFAIAEIFLYWNSGSINAAGLTTRLCEMLAITLFCFLGGGSYKSIIRHSGINDILKILITNIIAAAIFIAINAVNNQLRIVDNTYIPCYTEAVFSYSISIILMIFFRLLCQRFYNDYIRKRRPRNNVVIFGAGAAGVIAMGALQQDQTQEYNVVTFIDDDSSKISQSLNGVPIRRVRDVLNERYIRNNNIKTVLIAIPSIKVKYKQAITNRCLDLGLTVKAVPHVKTWINGTFQANQIENIKIEDLLERESIQIDNINITREVANKVVMVTGAAGSIGSEICRQLTQFAPSRIIMLDQAESPLYDLQFELRNQEPYNRIKDQMEFVIANVKDLRRIDEVFRLYKPEVVYHAAAYKHVPFMEENPYEAVYVNVFGTKNIADCAVKYGARKFVMVSTDKAVNPTNVMGATKRLAEIYIQSRSTLQTRFVTTRFGNVLGSNGSVIPLFKKQLANGGPLTVTHRDIIRYFMTIPEACSLVLEAGAMGEGGDIFVFDMGKPVKIYQLAERMIQLSGLKNIKIVETGLRPGEKLYEELLVTKENTIPTHHPKIMRAQVRKNDLHEIDKSFDELSHALESLNDMSIVACMKAIVPEFISNNSIYCQLDTCK
ncbi:MAG: polysaccharide biosynthesis protein [Bacteroidales bacterium]|nr:polysaccharide biosynthesis protein [Candidatus Colimorpha onthohippi]